MILERERYSNSRYPYAFEKHSIKELQHMQSKGKPLTKDEQNRVTLHAQSQRKQNLLKHK